MTHLQLTLPPALEHWIDTRIAEGRYANADDYLRDLIRRDQAGANDETTWLRELIEEGNASGVIEKDAKAVLREIMAERPARRG